MRFSIFYPEKTFAKETVEKFIKILLSFLDLREAQSGDANIEFIRKSGDGVRFGPRVKAVFYFMDFGVQSVAANFHLNVMAWKNISLHLGFPQAQSMRVAEHCIPGDSFVFRTAKDLQKSGWTVFLANACQKNCVQRFRHGIELFKSCSQFLSGKMIKNSFQKDYFFGVQWYSSLEKNPFGL